MIDGSVIEGIVFDMDGLLFDSERLVQRSWEDAGNELHILHADIHRRVGVDEGIKREIFIKLIDIAT